MLRSFMTTVIVGSAAIGGFSMMDASLAQSWPSRAVTLVVPYGPGASNDLFTRALATQLSKKFGQPFVVENRPGAGGFTASQQVSRAAPDGYTLLQNANIVVGAEPVMKVKFDATSDLTPIAMFAQAPNAIVISAKLPAKNLSEFIAYAKANEGNVFYGTSSLGGTQHTHAEQFNLLTGTKMKPVVYKSSADAQTDLIAGRLQIMFATLASVRGQIQAGDLRLIGYTDSGSPPGVPAAPTMEEAGFKGFGRGIWWGFFGPRGLPDDIRDRMNAAVNEAVQTPEFVDLLAKSGATPVVQNPAYFTGVIREELAALNKLIKDLNLKFE